MSASYLSMIFPVIGWMMGLARCLQSGACIGFCHLGINESELGCVGALKMNACSSSCAMRCDTWTVIGF